jgi:hypothetical protein
MKILRAVGNPTTGWHSVVDKDEPFVVTWPSDDASCTDDEENSVEERMQATTWSIQARSVVVHGEALTDGNYW